MADAKAPAKNPALDEALKKLMDQYEASQQAFTPKTPDEIRAQAEGEYNSYYDRLGQAAKDKQAQTDLALQQQQAGLQAIYDRRREDARKDYEDAYSRAENRQLSHGMQRSSYGAQVLANLQKEGVDMQADIGREQGTAEGNIGAQRAQLAAQLAAQLGKYDQNKADDILARIKALEDQNYDRGRDAAAQQNSLATQIYNILYQQERDRIADERWEQQHKGGGGTGGRGTIDKDKVKDKIHGKLPDFFNHDAADPYSTFDGFIGSLGGTTGGTTGPHWTDPRWHPEGFYRPGPADLTLGAMRAFSEQEGKRKKAADDWKKGFYNGVQTKR